MIKTADKLRAEAKELSDKANEKRLEAHKIEKDYYHSRYRGKCLVNESSDMWMKIIDIDDVAPNSFESKGIVVRDNDKGQLYVCNQTIIINPDSSTEIPEAEFWAKYDEVVEKIKRG